MRRRFLLGASRDQRLPIHVLHVDLESGPFHKRLGNGREVGQYLQVRRMHEHDGGAVVAGFLQKLLRLGEIRLQQPVHAFGRAKRSAADEHFQTRLVILRVPHGRLEEILLVEGVEQRLLDFGIVEGLHRRVVAKRVLVAERVDVGELDVGIILQHRQQVMCRLLDVVDFAGDECVNRRLLIGDHAPFDAIDFHDLAARHAGRRLRPRFVSVELDVHCLVARLPFLLLENEGPAAGEVADLLIGTRLSNPLGHHERRR